MLGNWSTLRRWYENKPSTTIASITIVANTGFFRLTWVNHMAGRSGQGAVRGAATGAGAASARAGLGGAAGDKDTGVPSRSWPMRPMITGVPSGTPSTATQVWPLSTDRAPVLTSA